MDLARLIEQKLQEAHEAGAFDALSRKGQLDLDDVAHVPEEDRMACARSFMPRKRALHAPMPAESHCWRKRKPPANAWPSRMNGNCPDAPSLAVQCLPLCLSEEMEKLERSAKLEIKD